MSTYVFMKLLESAPKRYDAGIQLLTLGKAGKAKEKIAEDFIRNQSSVLEIGCGTGTLALLMAKKGAFVTGIDLSDAMLEMAREKVEMEGLSDFITLRPLSAIQLDTEFQDERFDAVVATLVFSELSEDEQKYVLTQCRRVLKPDGLLIIADESLPKNPIGKILFFALRLPLAAITYVLTQTTTRAVRNIEGKISEAGFEIIETEAYLFKTLRLIQAKKKRG